VLTLVTGLLAIRNLLRLELLHLGLQGSAEGGPHIARFVARVKPYKLGQATGTLIRASRSSISGACPRR